MKVMNRIFLLIITAVLLFSCDGLLLTENPITRDNEDDPFFVGITTGEIRVTDGSDTVLSSDDDVDLGEVLLGGSGATLTLTIENTLADSELRFTGATPIEITGSDADDFAVSLQPDAAITAGSSFTFTVTYTPDGAGLGEAVLTINTNDTGTPAFEIDLSGTGVTEIIPVGEIKLSDDDGAEVDANSIVTFDNTTVGGSSSLNLTIENLSTEAALAFTGTTALVISGTDDDLFSVAAQPTASVAADSSWEFTVNFSPDAAEAASAVLTINTNDSDESAYVINLSGTGTAVVPGEITVNVDGSVYSSGGFAFEDTTTGQTDTVDVVIQNTHSTQDLVLQTSTDWLTGDSVFTGTSIPTTATTLAAGSSLTVTLTFAPTAVADYTGTLTIYSNDSDEGMVVIGLTGSGSAVTYSGSEVTVTALADGEDILVDSYISENGGVINVGGELEVKSGVTLTIYELTELSFDGDLTVNAGGTLNIHEGVELDMGSYQIIVDGTIEVNGTQSLPVVMTGSEWGGLLVSGTGTVDHAFLKNFDTSSGYAIRLGSSTSDRCSGFTLTNSRIHHEETSDAIQIYYPEEDGTYSFTNNIFYLNSTYSSWDALWVSSYFPASGVEIEFSYNTLVRSSYGGFAITGSDSQATSYTIENNIIVNSGGYTSSFIYFYSGPYVVVRYNIYGDNATQLGESLDVEEKNLAWDLAGDLSTIFTNPTLKDYSMKVTSEYPNLTAADSITELVGSLSTVNPVGAYGNGGTPPTP